MGKIFSFNRHLFKHRIYRAARIIVGKKDALDLTDIAMPLMLELGVELGNSPENNLKKIRTHLWAYVGITKTARTIAGLDMKFYRRNKDGTKDEVSDHRFRDLFYRPNDWMTHLEYWEYTLYHVLGAGSAYSFMDNPESGGLNMLGPTRLFPLMPYLVTPIPDEKNFIKGYEYTTPKGERKIYPPEQVLWIKTTDPLDYYKGLTPLTPATNNLRTDSAARERGLLYLEKGAEPGTVLMSDQSFDEEDDKRVKLNWRKHHEGVDKAASVALLWGGLKKEKPASSKDMGYEKLMEFNREEILGALMIPPATAGIMRYANYANAHIQDEIFWRENIVPMKRIVETKYNEMFFPIFEKEFEMFFEFDVSEVEALQGDKLNKAKVHNTYVSGGILTANEVRSDLGFDDHPDGNELRTLPQSFNSGSGDDGKNLDTTYSKGIIRLRRNKGRTQRWEAQREAMRSSEKSLHKDMKDYFNSIFPMIKSRALATTDVNDIDEIFRYSEEQPPLQKFLRPSIKEIINISGTRGVDLINDKRKDMRLIQTKDPVQITETAVFDITDPLIFSWIEQESFLLSKYVTDATIDQIRRVMTQALYAGDTIDEISRKLDEVLDYFLDYRTVRIARTEVNTAFNRGSLFGFEDAGVKSKVWLSARDPVRTRDWHLEADGQKVPINSSFIVNGEPMDFPGDPKASAENVINCRCVVDPEDI